MAETIKFEVETTQEVINYLRTQVSLSSMMGKESVLDVIVAKLVQGIENGDKPVRIIPKKEGRLG